MAINLRAHHTSFPVRDLERSRRFYEGILGMRQKSRPDFGFPGVWYESGDCEVHLIQTSPAIDVGAPPPALNPMARHEAFGIDDYNETLRHLKNNGIEVLETSPEQGQMWIRDPDGHIIELIVDRRTRS